MRSYPTVRVGRVDEVVGAVVNQETLSSDVNGEWLLTLVCTAMRVEAPVRSSRHAGDGVRIGKAGGASRG